jgi:hypothetical protein
MLLSLLSSSVNKQKTCHFCNTNKKYTYHFGNKVLREWSPARKIATRIAFCNGWRFGAIAYCNGLYVQRCQWRN